MICLCLMSLTGHKDVYVVGNRKHGLKQNQKIMGIGDSGLIINLVLSSCHEVTNLLQKWIKSYIPKNEITVLRYDY